MGFWHFGAWPFIASVNIYNYSPFGCQFSASFSEKTEFVNAVCCLVKTFMSANYSWLVLCVCM